jgi:hypothetical protein
MGSPRRHLDSHSLSHPHGENVEQEQGLMALISTRKKK